MEYPGSKASRVVVQMCIGFLPAPTPAMHPQQCNDSSNKLCSGLRVPVWGWVCRGAGGQVAGEAEGGGTLPAQDVPADHDRPRVWAFRPAAERQAGGPPPPCPPFFPCLQSMMCLACAMPLGNETRGKLHFLGIESHTSQSQQPRRGEQAHRGRTGHSQNHFPPLVPPLDKCSSKSDPKQCQGWGRVLCRCSRALQALCGRLAFPCNAAPGQWLFRRQAYAKSGQSIDMEACFSQLTLDVIGKSVFNYDFDALKTDSPLIQVGLGFSTF